MELKLIDDKLDHALMDITPQLIDQAKLTTQQILEMFDKIRKRKGITAFQKVLDYQIVIEQLREMVKDGS